jgi:hypothetical protein
LGISLRAQRFGTVQPGTETILFPGAMSIFQFWFAVT